jgi:hypothetical protein
MNANCPHPPRKPAALGVALHELPTGTRLVRFHSPKYQPFGFNPNVDSAGAPKPMAISTEGARFNPFPDATGVNVSTLYAGTTEHAAALESVFHDVSHVPDPTFATSRLKDFVLSHFLLQRPLRVLELVNPQLRQITVPRRKNLSLQESEIVHSSPDQYPITRQWAQHFYLSLPHLQGLAWRPRLGGEGTSYVFFGERLSVTTDFELEGSPTPIDAGAGRITVEKIAAAAHITLINTK